MIPDPVKRVRQQTQIIRHTGDAHGQQIGLLVAMYADLYFIDNLKRKHYNREEANYEY